MNIKDGNKTFTKGGLNNNSEDEYTDMFYRDLVSEMQDDGRINEEDPDGSQPPPKEKKRYLRLIKEINKDDIIQSDPTVLEWVKDDEASRVSRITAYRVSKVMVNKDTILETPYAPTIAVDSAGWDKASLYLQVTWQSISKLFCYEQWGDKETLNRLSGRQNFSHISWPNMKKMSNGTIVYIPVAFLYALAENKNPWPEIKDLGTPLATNLHNMPFKFEKQDKLFSTENSFEKIDQKRLWVPLRNREGRLIFCLHGTSWQTAKQANALKIEWRNAFATIPPPSVASGDRAARYQTVPVGDLKIKMTKLGQDRWKNRTCNAEGVFQHFIDKINQDEATNRGKASLLMPDDNVPDGYQFLSEHPFGLYRTYISSANHDAYMKRLLAGCFKTQAEDELTYTLSRNPNTGKMEITDPRALPKITTNLIKNLRPKQKMMERGGKRTMSEARASGQSAIKKGDKRTKIHEPSIGDIQTLTFVNVTAQKARMAKGRRKADNVYQADVMGMSAPKTCVDFFDWKWVDPKERAAKLPDLPPSTRTTAYKENEMINGLYIAEASWLHLSAYSWGGLADPTQNGQIGQAGSSQVYQNLVIGTSETNSAMTRWEKAWQKLIRCEGDILTSAGTDGSQYGGVLTIIRHPYTTLPRSVFDDQENKAPVRYSQHKAYAPFLHDVANPPGGDGEFRYTVKKHEMNKDLQLLAKEFRWICFQFDYDIKIQGASRILGLQNGVGGKTRFYPFRRMLYHKIEHDLDSYLWKDMLMEADKGIEMEYKDGKATVGKQRDKQPAQAKGKSGLGKSGFISQAQSTGTKRIKEPDTETSMVDG